MTPETTDRIESRDPRTGDLLGTVENTDADAVADAVGRAAALQRRWGADTVRIRAAHLRRIRRALVRRGLELARINAAETGKSLTDAMYEVGAMAYMFEWAAWSAPRALAPRRVSTFPIVAKRCRVEFSPYGVVAAIMPWNYPVGIAGQVLPWVLAAGNTVVMKPSELAPLTGRLLGEVVNGAGVDLIRVVTGDGGTGAALVRSPGIGKIVFTGSGATARRILVGAAEHLTPAVMELGGKDAMIVTNDADLAAAARSAVAAAFFNAGQTCLATERVVVTTGAHGPLVAEIVARTAELRVGPEPDCHVGPLTEPGAVERLLVRVNDAVASGARVVAGGRRPPGLGPGYLEPTVLVDVDPGAEIVREESFGPVLCILQVPDVDTAVAVANDTSYGLASSVFAGTRAQARAIASRMVAGGVVVDDVAIGAGIASLPFGGEKGSGFGRLMGREGFEEFSRRRTVVESRLPLAMMTMMARARPDAQTVSRVLDALMGGGGLRRRRQALRRER